MVSREYGLVEAAGAGGVLEKQNKKFKIVTDEIGLNDFNCDLESELLLKLEECIKDIKFSTSLNFSEFVMYLKANELWLKICSKTSERVIKELEEDYGETKESIEENIKNQIQLLIASYFRNIVSEPYKISIQPFVNYLDFVNVQFKKLVDTIQNSSDEESLGNKQSAVYPKYKSDLCNLLSVILDGIDEFVDKKSAYNLEIRVNDLSKRINQLEQLINSYLSLSADQASCLIDKKALDETENIWSIIVEKADLLSFDSNIYLYLIKLVKKKYGSMPGTLSVVLSEINNFALRNNIILDGNNMLDGSLTEFQVPPSSDSDEAGRSLTYINSYGRRIYFE